MGDDELKGKVDIIRGISMVNIYESIFVKLILCGVALITAFRIYSHIIHLHIIGQGIRVGYTRP